MRIQSSTAKVAMSTHNSKPDFNQFGTNMAAAIENAIFPLLSSERRKLVLDDHDIDYKNERIYVKYHVEGFEDSQEDECSFDELATYLKAKDHTLWCLDSVDGAGNHIQEVGEDDPYEMIKDPMFSASFILQAFINDRGY